VILEIILLLVMSYLLGSLPTGLILTKIFLNKDIRNIGSGNIGATNVLRTGNKLLAFLTLFLDVLKGYLTIYLTAMYFPEYIFFSGLICFLGHIFPVWLSFKGGKGIATYLGILLAMSFNLAIIFCMIWIFILLIFRYSSLSSISGSLCVFIATFIFKDPEPNIIFFIFFMIIIFTHKENIIRLINKNESKIKF
tara:strand:- start:17 stop:598 length:582 start_codon:yes stop_codon:yes gene_type:complete